MDGVYCLLRPTNPTEFWAMVAALGTVALSVTAAIGLRSLVLTRRDMLTRAKRDARECAIARFAEMAKQIIPANGALWAAIAASKVNPIIVRSPGEVMLDPDNPEHLKLAVKVRESFPSEVVKDTIFFLNQLETWAAYHTKGLADHEIAFGPCAPVFCGLIYQHYAILLTCRKDTSAGNFPNVVELFKSWRADLAQKELDVREEDLQRKVQALETARSKQRSSLQPPLGFDA